MKLIAKKRELELYELDEPIDLTKEAGVKTLVKYELRGLGVDILVIFQEENENEDALLLGYMLGETGLLVSLTDEEMHNKAVAFITDSLDEGQ